MRLTHFRQVVAGAGELKVHVDVTEDCKSVRTAVIEMHAEPVLLQL